MGCAPSRPSPPRPTGRFDPRIPVYIPNTPLYSPRPRQESFDAERHGDAYAQLDARSVQAKRAQQEAIKAQKVSAVMASSQSTRVPIPSQQQQRRYQQQRQQYQQKPLPQKPATKPKDYRLTRPFDANIPVYTMPKKPQSSNQPSAQGSDAARHRDAMAKLTAKSTKTKTMPIRGGWQKAQQAKKGPSVQRRRQKGGKSLRVAIL